MTTFTLLDSPHWQDYGLLDSGDGLKLERFGRYIFVRPESQAMWSRTLSPSEWQNAHAVFEPTGEESGGHWNFKKKVDEKWEMRYPLAVGAAARQDLRFWAMTTPGRHVGVFPEGAAHWDWTGHLIHHRIHGEKQSLDSVNSAGPVVNVLNLFGYTGLATLAAAAAGAKVAHVDASKKAVAWARDNQVLSGLEEKPVRWLVDDASKFVQREARRGVKYDGLILDPPKFGRGPKGEVWEVYKSLPALLAACRECLSDRPLFVAITIYAVRASAVHVAQALDEMMKGYKGKVESGELVTREESAGRLLSQAVYARWTADDGQ